MTRDRILKPDEICEAGDIGLSSNPYVLKDDNRGWFEITAHSPMWRQRVDWARNPLLAVVRLGDAPFYCERQLLPGERVFQHMVAVNHNGTRYRPASTQVLPGTTYFTPDPERFDPALLNSLFGKTSIPGAYREPFIAITNAGKATYQSISGFHQVYYDQVITSTNNQPSSDWLCRSPACAAQKTTSPQGYPCWRCGARKQ